jgi:hypothetical protein
MVNFADLEHHVSQNLFGVILYLSLFKKLPCNHGRNGLILGKLDVSVPFGTGNNQFKTLVQDNKNVLVVNVIIDDVFIHTVYNDFNYGLGVVRASDHVMFPNDGQHELWVFGE